MIDAHVEMPGPYGQDVVSGFEISGPATVSGDTAFVAIAKSRWFTEPVDSKKWLSMPS